MPGDLLDLILVAIAAAFAVAGYRQGFIVGVLSFIGFIGGAALAAAFAPGIAHTIGGSPSEQALIAIVIVFVAAMAGQLIASVAGAAVRARVTWRPAALVDSAGGAGVSVLSVLLIAWFIGSAVAEAPFPTVTRQVNNSAVLRGVDHFMPPAAQTMFSDFRRLLATGPYPQVFSALGAEGALSVPAPSPGVLNSPALGHDRPSIVKIHGIAPVCDSKLEGTGFVYAPQHVLTNAHVVAAVDTGLVVVPGGHRRDLDARVVLYDPQHDVAVLYVPGLHARPLRFAPRAPRGASAIVAGYPGDKRFTAVPARVGGVTSATVPNIYRTSLVTRTIYSLRAAVRPGNSGGPLLAPDGAVYGVVFAAAVGTSNVGYALTTSVVAKDASEARTATQPVSTEPNRCD